MTGFDGHSIKVVIMVLGQVLDSRFNAQCVERQEGIFTGCPRKLDRKRCSYRQGLFDFFEVKAESSSCSNTDGPDFTGIDHPIDGANADTEFFG